MNKIKYRWTYSSIGCKYKNAFYATTVLTTDETKTLYLSRLDLSTNVPAWYSDVSKMENALRSLQKANAVDINVYLENNRIQDLVEIAQILSSLEIFEYKMDKYYKSISDKNIKSLIKIEEMRNKLSEEIKTLNIDDCSRLMQNIKKTRQKVVLNG